MIGKHTLSDFHSVKDVGIGFMSNMWSVLINSLNTHFPLPKLPHFFLLLPCLWILYSFEASEHYPYILFSQYSFIFTHIVALCLSRIIFLLPEKSFHFFPLIQMHWQWFKLCSCFLVWKFLYFTGTVER